MVIHNIVEMVHTTQLFLCYNDVVREEIFSWGRTHMGTRSLMEVMGNNGTVEIVLAMCSLT